MHNLIINYAPYACRKMQIDRLFVEGASENQISHERTDFQRDRDRIVHASAFRRLQYKTQVFVYHEGDYFRTRLTHSIEVAQIARTISRSLRFNEDLSEAKYRIAPTISFFFIIRFIGVISEYFSTKDES